VRFIERLWSGYYNVSSRWWWGEVLRSWCEKAVTYLPSPRVIRDREGKNPYLSRHYLTGGPRMEDGSNPFEANGDPKRDIVWGKRGPIGIYLHKFHQGDDAGELHNHPWKWAFSVVLAGGYSEERRQGDKVIRRRVAPLSLNFILGSTYHRVDLYERDAWTIFVVGKKVTGWGFWNRDTSLFTPWQLFKK
jgi:hypothetical protein